MESGSLSSPEFAEFSKTVVPFLHVTTRIKGREGDDLLKVYGGTGFPTLKFLDAKGEAVAEPAGRSVAAFQTTAGALNEVASLKKRIKAGEKGLKPELLAAEMDLGGVKLAEAQERLATFKKVKPAIKAKISAMIVDMEIMEVMATMTRDNQEEVTEKLVKMAKDGKIATGKAIGRFWSSVYGWADKNGDIKLAEQAYKYLYQQYGSDKGNAEYFEKMKTRIAELKKPNPDA